MDIQFYQNFITIVEQGNLTAAAQKLHVAQPALSNQLKTLEKHYGAQLLTRYPRHMELTDAGRIFYETAKRINILESSAKQDIYDCVQGLSGTLRLGLTFAFSASMFDGLLLEYHKKYPLVKYELYEKETYEILDLLRSGVVEVGIARSPFAEAAPEMEFFHEHTDDFYAVWNKNADWLPEKEVISIEDLRDVPICVARRFEALFNTSCQSQGFLPNTVCTVTQITSSLTWARAGLAVAIVPYSIYSNMKGNDLCGCWINEKNLVTTRSIITLKNRRLSVVAQKFCEDCKVLFSST